MQDTTKKTARGTGWLALGLPALLAVSGCATTHAPVVREFRPPAELKWFRAAAERQALVAQGYRQALELVKQRRPASGPWAVILDADETILDNSTYQERLARTPGAEWKQGTWDAWVVEQKAVAFPPAVAFVDEVVRLGGRIAIVSNRSEPTCAATRENLDKQKVRYDVVLCAPLKSDGKPDSDKEARFASVAQGAAFGSGPVAVVLYVGDNIKDCSGQTQARFDLAKFGTDCVVLPNPMYGSWQSVPYPPAEP